MSLYKWSINDDEKDLLLGFCLFVGTDLLTRVYRMSAFYHFIFSIYIHAR